jgi:uncharacterized protein YcfL
MQFLHPLPSLLALLALLSACAASPTNPKEIAATHNERVQILTGFWGTNARITDISNSINSSHLLLVQITGVNDGSDYLQMEYRAEWLDKNGMLIPSKMTHWIQFPAYEETEFRLRIVAPKPEATDYKILIREVQD